jgi:hypothetical protein
MSYLSRLKQLDGKEAFTHSPKPELTKLPKAPSVSSVSTVQGRIEKITTANDPATASWGWLIHYADRDPVESYFSPMVTHAEVMVLRPDAIAAEPIPCVVDQTGSPGPDAFKEPAAIGALRLRGSREPQ